MTNLLHLIVALAEDAESRTTFREDPDGALRDLDDLTGEDVAAAADVARVQVAPGLAGRLVQSMDLRPRDDESERDVAVRALLAICDAVDGDDQPAGTWTIST